ncbi:hypothetical protein FRC15_000704 [Serendipita sp. 397]|nr:hypothetical protein FRC15_000704 [Serendipita sp. 397]
MQAGLASGHTALKILDMSKVVYTAATSDASKGKGERQSHFVIPTKTKCYPQGKSKEAPVSSFPFEFELPSTADNSTDLLPPTFRGVHPVMEGIIKYIIKVTVVKFGLWPRETFSTVIHYLPKYYLRDEALLWPAISLMDAKRFGLECNNKWRTSKAHLLYDPEESSRLQNPGMSTSKNAPLPELSVSIPSTAQAVANYCFPVNVTLRLPNHTEEYIEELLTDSTRFSIAMMKSITMTVNGQKSSQIINLARANKQQVERELVSSTTERIVRGWFRAGTNEGEASWKIGDLVETKYFIRVTVHLEPKQPPIFKHDEPIQMFTHSKEQFASPFEIQDAPAPNLLLASSLGNTRQRF